MGVGQKRYLKNPIGKRKNQPSYLWSPFGVFFLTHNHIFIEQHASPGPSQGWPYFQHSARLARPGRSGRPRNIFLNRAWFDKVGFYGGFNVLYSFCMVFGGFTVVVKVVLYPP